MLGASVEAAAALLLVAGPGALATAGFLIALSLATLAASLWVGPPEGAPTRRASRWYGAVAALLLAGIFAHFWSGSAALRGAGWGRALAVPILLALPVYAIGSVVAVLDRRGRGIAVASLAGAAVGVLAAAVWLIPKVDPGAFFLAGAATLFVASWLDRAGGGGAKEGTMREKVVVVTGVGEPGQMGYALAEAFRAEGARLVVTDVRPGIEATARELGGETIGVEADLTRTDDADRVVSVAREAFGRVDVLVNVAGGLSVIKPLGETTLAEWEREVDRNARTAFVMSHAALPALRESRGAIVNFASPAGIRAVASLGAYSAAKAAVVAMTRALALEERENGLRVNAVAPGMIDTEQNRRAVADPDRIRWVTREEVARVVLFLASDASAGVSGETIHVLGDGLE